MKNKEGEEMIDKLRENDMHIINGDTKGDKKEDFTYVGGGGSDRLPNHRRRRRKGLHTRYVYR